MLSRCPTRRVARCKDFAYTWQLKIPESIAFRALNPTKAHWPQVILIDPILERGGDSSWTRGLTETLTNRNLIQLIISEWEALVMFVMRACLLF